MKLKEFKAFEEFEQFGILFDHGVLLLDRTDNYYSYLLYQIDGFYAEIKHQLNADAITGLTSFELIDLPEMYLEEIIITI